MPITVASGVRSSWETASRKVFFISSSARSWRAAYRSRCSARCSRSSAWRSASSACFCSVMSM
jgi:hypothetical protein